MSAGPPPPRLLPGRCAMLGLPARLCSSSSSSSPGGAARTASGPAGVPRPLLSPLRELLGVTEAVSPSLQFPRPQDAPLSPCTPPRTRGCRALPARCLHPGSVSLGCPRMQAPRVPSPSSWPRAWGLRGQPEPHGTQRGAGGLREPPAHTGSCRRGQASLACDGELQPEGLRGQVGRGAAQGSMGRSLRSGAADE